MNRPCLFLTALVGVSGCDQVADFLPTVSFDGLEVRSIDWEEADVDFVFSVNNPHPISIGLSSFSYNLDLETVPFLSGDNPDGFQLEAEGAAPLVLPLDLRYEDIWTTIQATRGEDVVDFGLFGNLGFNTPAGEALLPYDEDGGFPALRTPTFRFQAVRVTDTGFRALGVVGLEVDLGVDNEHASQLFFDNFDYALALNGTNIVDGVVSTFDIDGATEGTLTLPISVSLLDIGFELFDVLLSGGVVDLGITAGVDVETPFGIVPLTIDEEGLGLDIEL